MAFFRYIILLICALTAAFDAVAQMPIKLRVLPAVPPDSADVAYYSKPHFWRAAGEVVGFNFGLWAFDRYIQRGDFAYISMNSVKENFRKGFKWDNDKLGTNMFLHPYNGSLYYNSARSNGFNYWQSALFAIGGSAMWELFMECEYPSTNDIIATPIGGTVIGEVLFRASDAVIDDRDTGASRFGREAAVFVISPMRGLTRIITGDAWRVRPTRGRLYGTPPLSVEFSLGARGVYLNNEASESAVGATAEINIEYGDRFEVSSTKPFDYFTVRADLSGMSKQPLLSQLNIKGRLIAREIYDIESRKMSIGLYQHFDYYDSDTIRKAHQTRVSRVPYKLGIPASLGAGWMFRDARIPRWAFDAYAHGNVVILGSILSDYYHVDERNYNLASGFSFKGGVNLVFDHDKFSASLSHEYYRLFTWKGYHRDTNLAQTDPRTLDVQGDHSAASFNVSELRADLRVWNRLYLSASVSHYYRSTRYRDYPRVKSSTTGVRLMVTYKL